MNAANASINKRLVDPLTKLFRKVLDKFIGDKFTTKLQGTIL